MVKIRSFKGFLPNKQKYKTIVSPPYDVLNREEALIMSKQTPQSFLHINKPEIDVEQAKENPYCDKVYSKGRQNLLKAIENGWLVQDSTRRMYIYSMKMGDHLQKGIVCLASVDDYEKDFIKKHEQTLPKKEQDRTTLADVQGANAGPVFITYPQNQDVAKIINSTTDNQKPLFDMIGEDDKVWQVSQENSKSLESHFEGQIPYIYIADGHHRAKAAFNVGKLRKQRAGKNGVKVTGDQDFNFFMAILFADDNLLCMDYNRVVKSLNDMSSEEFIAQVKEGYTLEEAGKAHQFAPKTTKHGHSYMLIDQKWYSMSAKGEGEEEKKQTNPVKSLDVQILTDRVLHKILGVQNIKTDPRVDFIGGIRGYKELEKRCQEDCKVAFLMHPVGLDQIMKVANAGLDMPPKSTWFEPKPKSGFVVRVFED